MKRTTCVAALTLLLVAGAVGTASASHSWNGYHWARTSNPFTIKLGDNVSSGWDQFLSQTSYDWSLSSVLHTTIVPGQARGKCRPTAGRVEVCSGAYGNNGWLGLAQIWITGSHITQGTVKVNDTYFSSPTYNNTAEKEHVMCQEVGHTFGLDHQDTSGISLDTCMDYYHNTSDSDTQSTRPNQHDYDELATIYAHLDSTNTIGAAAGSPGNAPDWTPAGERSNVYVTHLGADRELVTFVTWADQA